MVMEEAASYVLRSREYPASECRQWLLSDVRRLWPQAIRVNGRSQKQLHMGRDPTEEVDAEVARFESCAMSPIIRALVRCTFRIPTHLQCTSALKKLEASRSTRLHTVLAFPSRQTKNDLDLYLSSCSAKRFRAALGTSLVDRRTLLSIHARALAGSTVSEFSRALRESASAGPMTSTEAYVTPVLILTLAARDGKNSLIHLTLLPRLPPLRDICKT